MKRIWVNIRVSSLVVFSAFLLVFFASFVLTESDKFTAYQKTKPELSQFAGSASCINCHKEIYDSHIQTAHYLDSRPASKKFVKGSFKPGENKFVYNKFMEVVMEEKNDSLFQTALINGEPFRRESFDIVIGSGRKGQTYLYWNDAKLYQLPVSFYTNLQTWCNSPGFPMSMVKFERIIPGECLECHGTFAKVSTDENQQPFFDRTQIIYGIDCERCHGPAAQHVQYHKENPGDKTAKFIPIISKLTRQQRLDGCALCHSGFRDPIQPAFSFSVGDTLDQFSVARYSPDSASTLDVHGNQYGLLTASKCFKNSLQMDCASCHDVHVNEVNKKQIFSTRCITCHSDTKHTSLNIDGNKSNILRQNCIDCHMPMLPSSAIVLNVNHAANAVPDEVRTHRVAIYEDKTAEMMRKIKMWK